MTSAPPRWRAAAYVLNEARFDEPEFLGQGTDYMICATPRCGSTLLGFLLHGSGMMGVPHEYLNTRSNLKALASRLGLMGAEGTVNMDAYMAAIRRKRTTPNGVFGLKVLRGQLAPFLKSPSVAAIVERGRLIRLRRRDQLAQAISFYMANATGIWSTFEDRTAGTDHPEYNAQEIRRCLEELRAGDAFYTALFAARGITALDVWYEDLIADPDIVCKSICRFTGVETAHSFDLEQTRLQRQANAHSEEWKQRYRAEHGLA